MVKKSLSERDVCTKYITPSISSAGWNIDTHEYQDQPAVLHQRAADQGGLVLRASISHRVQELLQDQADAHRGVRAREGLVGEP